MKSNPLEEPSSDNYLSLGELASSAFVFPVYSATASSLSLGQFKWIKLNQSL